MLKKLIDNIEEVIKKYSDQLFGTIMEQVIKEVGENIQNEYIREIKYLQKELDAYRGGGDIKHMLQEITTTAYVVRWSNISHKIYYTTPLGRQDYEITDVGKTFSIKEVELISVHLTRNNKQLVLEYKDHDGGFHPAKILIENIYSKADEVPEGELNPIFNNILEALKFIGEMNELYQPKGNSKISEIWDTDVDYGIITPIVDNLKHL